MQYQREISNKILLLAKEFPALVLTGARQVGKTTLLQNLFPEYNYVSLDLPSTADLAQNNPDLFLKKYQPPLIVDEVQYAPQLFRHLKIWIDQHRNLKGQFLLTGSQKFRLMKEVSDSLAGRVAILELEPLSLFEIEQKKVLSSSKFPAIMARGFFPELWKDSHRNTNAYYSSYLQSYIERDVRQLANIGNLLDFEKLVRLCAGRAGQILVKSELAKDVGVTVNTINSWLSVLESSNQIIFLQPYYENFGKRMIKSPKMYFADTGFLLYLLGHNEDSILESSFIGAVWENLVFNELRKRYLSVISSGQFWYYRDNQAREVDILFQNKGKVHFIETKWSTQPEKSQALKLETIAHDLKSKTVKKGNCYIIARCEDQIKLGSETIVQSIHSFKLPL